MPCPHSVQRRFPAHRTLLLLNGINKDKEVIASLLKTRRLGLRPLERPCFLGQTSLIALPSTSSRQGGYNLLVLFKPFSSNKASPYPKFCSNLPVQLGLVEFSQTAGHGGLDSSWLALRFWLSIPKSQIASATVFLHGVKSQGNFRQRKVLFSHQERAGNRSDLRPAK